MASFTKVYSELDMYESLDNLDTFEDFTNTDFGLNKYKSLDDMYDIESSTNELNFDE